MQNTIPRAQLGCLALSLYLFYLVGHQPFSNMCYFLRDTYSEAVYRQAIVSIGCFLLLCFSAWLAWHIKHGANKLWKSSAWGIFAALLSYFYNDMVKISIEYVHFIQYCSLTLVLTHALPRHIGLAVGIAMLAGLVDELYQTLEPAVQFNVRDTGLNVIGCLWGWLVWWTIKTDEQ